MLRCFYVLFAMFLSTAALAQSGSDIPDLVGTWAIKEGSYAGAHWSGALSHASGPKITLTVKEQLNAAFHGTYSFQPVDSQPEFEGSKGLSRSLSETVVGIVGWDNVTIYWADRDDETTYTGTLTDGDTMQVIALEAGPHAISGRFILIRQFQ